MCAYINVIIPIDTGNSRSGAALNGRKNMVVRFKPSSMEWDLSVDNYCQTASFIIPSKCAGNTKITSIREIKNADSTGDYLKEGDKVQLYAGYDNKYDLQFSGFISRINFDKPLKVECEGYSYQLRNKIINKSFSKTTVKEVLNYLIKGTNIRLSPQCPDKVVFESAGFKNKNGIEVLEYLKEKYLLTIFFQSNVLYVGWLATYKSSAVKFRLRWNVIKNDQLLYRTYTGSKVNIYVASRNKSGTKEKAGTDEKNKSASTKTINTYSRNMDDKKLMAKDAQLRQNSQGYSGSITAFLVPYVRPGMTAIILDKENPKRDGSYFIESVKGSFGPGGGRQVIGISFALSTEKKELKTINI